MRKIEWEREVRELIEHHEKLSDEGAVFTSDGRWFNYGYLESLKYLIDYIKELCFTDDITIFSPLEYLPRDIQSTDFTDTKILIPMPEVSTLRSITLEIDINHTVHCLSLSPVEGKLSIQQFISQWGNRYMKHHWDNLGGYKAICWCIAFTRVVVTFDRYGSVFCISIYPPIQYRHLKSLPSIPSNFSFEYIE